MGASSSTRRSRSSPAKTNVSTPSGSGDANTGRRRASSCRSKIKIQEQRPKSAASSPCSKAKTRAGEPTKHDTSVQTVMSVDEFLESEPFIVKNLDTGQVRDLLREEPDDEVLGTWEEQDFPAGHSSAWCSWWQEHRRKSARLFETTKLGDAAGLKHLLDPPEKPSDPTAAAELEGASACFLPPSITPTDPNTRALHGRTALHVAADRGHVECVKVLLSSSASIDAQTHSGFTPLHMAADRGHVEVMCTLLAASCKPGVQTDQGELPLHLASAKGHQQALEFLVDYCSPDLLSKRNSFGQRPSEVCHDVSTFRIFQEHGSFAFTRSTAETSSTATPHGSFAIISDSDAADDDLYAGRTLFEKGSVLLRNSRPDVVQRLLRSVRQRTESTDGLAQDNVSSTSTTKNQSRQRRQPFVKLQNSESSGFGVVGPQSFNLLALLGRGTFGEVFQISHKTTGQVYAMKVLRKGRMLARNITRYAVTERNLLSYIQHPYIVKMHYAFQTPSCLVLVLQYCPGGNLSALLRREGTLPEAVVRLYMAEVLLALAYLHCRQVLYRDLKPENVVLDDDSHAMLTDFGLSKEGVEGPQAAKSFCGSVAYLAPEILTRSGHGRAVDVYGLGVLLFEMLSGHPPYYSRDKSVLLRNIATAELRAPVRASQNAAKLIYALMHRDPASRLGAQDVSEVREHPFFIGLDFEKVLQREVPVPPFRRQTMPIGPRSEKFTNPFEGRLGIFKSWKAATKDFEGWEYSAADVLSPTFACARSVCCASSDTNSSQSRRRVRSASDHTRARVSKISAGLLRPMLAF
eukprot:TRINITY_DN43511_c0_g1_i1.p1 TRINITY_DN43511_c0_g1~~TRINITY_DN43511_c0_g1_i1.p1  ORF type:complete len:814 (-),score=123.26 TRINITY_DN43511_c0_g1_i1:15-2423(-)